MGDSASPTGAAPGTATPSSGDGHSTAEARDADAPSASAPETAAPAAAVPLAAAGGAEVAAAEVCEPGTVDEVAAATGAAAAGSAASEAPHVPAGLATIYHDHDFDWLELAEAGRAWEERLAAHRDAEGADAGDAGSDADAGDGAACGGGGAADAAGDAGESEAVAWDSFHGKHNKGRVYRPRRYLFACFPELLRIVAADATEATGGATAGSERPAPLVVELGSGCGANVLPLLSAGAASRARIVAVDTSEVSLEVLSQQHAFDASRCRLVHCDAARAPLPLADSVADAGLAFFVLSAVPRGARSAMVRELARVLRPGAPLCLRDYGLYDHRQLKLKPSSALDVREGATGAFYRADGTLTCFFSIEALRELMADGEVWEEEELRYSTVLSVNRRKGTEMRRVFVHGKWRRR